MIVDFALGVLVGLAIRGIPAETLCWVGLHRWRRVWDFTFPVHRCTHCGLVRHYGERG